MPFTIVPDTLPIFPTALNFDPPGGPEYLTDVEILGSGHEQRNSFWPEPRYSWDVGYGVRTHDKIYALLQFFHACRGRKNPFRYKDWSDYKSCARQSTVNYNDQSLGTAIAGQVNFQLKKTYTEGSYSTVILIYKPRGSTVRIGFGGAEETSNWTVNEQTGIITRATPATGGEAVTWGGEFYRKARFDVDKLPVTFYHWTSGSIQVPVIHVR